MKELLLELSYNCNFNCIHCSSVNCDGMLKVTDLDNFETIIQQIKLVRISGGEALLNNNLDDFVDFFNNQNINVVLQTNGFFKIPKEIYKKLHQINLSLYSKKDVHNFITQNEYSFDHCMDRIRQCHDKIVICSPIFTQQDSFNVMNLACKYDLPVRFTALINHGKCNFAKPLLEQIEIFNLIKTIYDNDKIESHCSLSPQCILDEKFVIKPNKQILHCASTKQGLGPCKTYIE